MHTKEKKKKLKQFLKCMSYNLHELYPNHELEISIHTRNVKKYLNFFFLLFQYYHDIYEKKRIISRFNLNQIENYV